MKLLKSKESEFIALNLRQANMVIAAKENLSEELRQIFPILKDRLEKKTWWTLNWMLQSYPNNEDVYLTHRNWFDEEQSTIRIGIEYFSADSLFASSKPPQLYIWIGQKDPILWRKMANLLEKHLIDSDTITDHESARGKYLVRRTLNKFPGAEKTDVNSFLEEIIEETFSFITHYTQILIKEQVHKKNLQKL